ncbi:MAG: 4Fe-4S binding protein [Methanospirillum sp.]
MVLELVDASLSVGPGCISCGTCADICPVGALEVADEE